LNKQTKKKKVEGVNEETLTQKEGTHIKYRKILNKISKSIWPN